MRPGIVSDTHRAVVLKSEAFLPTPSIVSTALDDSKILFGPLSRGRNVSRGGASFLSAVATSLARILRAARFLRRSY